MPFSSGFQGFRQVSSFRIIIINNTFCGQMLNSFGLKMLMHVSRRSWFDAGNSDVTILWRASRQKGCNWQV